SISHLDELSDLNFNRRSTITYLDEGVWEPMAPDAFFMPFDGYDTGGFHDEMFNPDGTPRACARLLFERITSVGDAELRRYQQAAEQALFRMGITFNVYGDEAGTEKIFPFDIIPRIVPADEWAQIDRGLRQRVHALNCFIDDIYHEQKILRD